MTPVRPPKVKVIRKPIAQSIGVSKLRDHFHIVPIQLKNFTPVGTAMRNVMKEKNGSSTRPVTYMWCAHTVTERRAMELVAAMRLMYPNIGFRLKTGMTSLLMPKNGSAMMYTSGWPKNQKRCC